MAVDLLVHDYWFRYGAVPVLRGVTLDALLPGCVTALIGPNAAGKSTLFRCIAGVLRGTGAILLDARDTRQLRRSDVSQRISYLPQNGLTNAVLTVFEAVLLARQVSASWRVGEHDLAAVGGVLDELGIAHLALRGLNELSGGQRQIVSIAQALVRDPEVLLLDEPTNSLDLHHQLEVLDIVQTVTRARAITTLIALHDLNLAGRYADHVVVMQHGTVYAAGDAEVVVTAQMLRDVYRVEARVTKDLWGNVVVQPVRSLRQVPEAPSTGWEALEAVASGSGAR